MNFHITLILDHTIFHITLILDNTIFHITLILDHTIFHITLILDNTIFHMTLILDHTIFHITLILDNMTFHMTFHMTLIMILCERAQSALFSQSAPIFRQSKKCRQKHGGFSRLLTPSGSFWQWYLPLTNRDPLLY